MTTAIKSDVAKQSSFFVAASIFSAVCNYILYIACARILTSSQYGDLALVLAVSNQVLGTLFATNLLSIYLIHNKGESYARSVLELIQRRILIMILGITLLTVTLGGYFAYLVGVQDKWLVLCLCLILLSAIPASIWLAYFQANKEFTRISIYNLVSSISKFVLTLTGALTGGVRAALLGVVLGQVIGLVATRIYPGVNPPSLSSAILKKPTKTVTTYFRMHRTTFWVAVFSVLTFSFAQNADILLANAFLDKNTAGSYSGISLISNAIYYLGFLFLWVLLPQLLQFSRTKQRQLLKRIISLMILLGSLCTLGSWLLGDLLVSIFLGNNNSDISSALPFAVMYQISLITSALVVYFFILQDSVRKAASITALMVVLGAGITMSMPRAVTAIPIGLLAAVLATWTCYGIIISVRNIGKYV